MRSLTHYSQYLPLEAVVFNDKPIRPPDGITHRMVGARTVGTRMVGVFTVTFTLGVGTFTLGVETFTLGVGTFTLGVGTFTLGVETWRLVTRGVESLTALLLGTLARAASAAAVTGARNTLVRSTR